MSSAIVGDKSKLPLHQKRTRDTSFDRIWKFYNIPEKRVKLSPTEEKMRKRCELAWAYLRTFLPRHKIAIRISKKFNVDVRTGYNDIKLSMLIFGNPEEQFKDAKRAILSSQLEDRMRKAISRDDDEIFEKLAFQYRRLWNLDNHDQNQLEDLLKKQLPIQINFTIDENTLKEHAKELMEDVKDIDFELTE